MIVTRLTNIRPIVPEISTLTAVNEHFQTVTCLCVEVAESHSEANTRHRLEDRSSKTERSSGQREGEFPNHDTVGWH
jgi:hypothetical protein